MQLTVAAQHPIRRRPPQPRPVFQLATAAGCAAHLTARSGVQSSLPSSLQPGSLPEALVTLGFHERAASLQSCATSCHLCQCAKARWSWAAYHRQRQWLRLIVCYASSDLSGMLSDHSLCMVKQAARVSSILSPTGICAQQSAHRSMYSVQASRGTQIGSVAAPRKGCLLSRSSSSER